MGAINTRPTPPPATHSGYCRKCGTMCIPEHYYLAYWLSKYHYICPNCKRFYYKPNQMDTIPKRGKRTGPLLPHQNLRDAIGGLPPATIGKRRKRIRRLPHFKDKPEIIQQAETPLPDVKLPHLRDEPDAL